MSQRKKKDKNNVLKMQDKQKTIKNWSDNKNNNERK